MRLSKVADYAVRSVVNLAMKDNKEPVPIKDIAEEEDIPPYFLAKVARILIAAGIVKARRGRAGGISLSKDASHITLKEVIEAANGPILMTRCFDEGSKCHKESYCSVHPALEETQRNLIEMLESYSIADMAEKHIAGESERLDSLSGGKSFPECDSGLIPCR